MNIILAIDSFKGCLSSEEAGKAASKAFSTDDKISQIIISDGGEGFTDAVMKALGGHLRSTSVQDPLGRRISASYAITGNGSTAIIETAAAGGLGLLKQSERNPLKTTSFGTGMLIADALDSGAENIYLGLGGSATNDAGTGLLQALGYRFISPDGIILHKGNTVLSRICGIDGSRKHPGLSNCRISGFYDVNVPFYGKGGATYMFSSQKGAGKADSEALERWMTEICALYSRYSGIGIKNTEGSGAAGGIGGALTGILNADMKKGIDKILDINDFDGMVKNCDFVVTGEGKADIQTLQGKAPKGILDRTREMNRNTKIILLAGTIENGKELYEAGFDTIIQVTPGKMPLTEALDKRTAENNITKALSDYFNL
ncbi:MAG: glycerate kinase [Bacteroidales bacterium]|jgi:glycerate kinase|nr:glycerate kinase [Bacteroidales bacterium]